MENKTEIRFGGFFLILGALITIICILLEVNEGWASLVVEMNRTDYEAGQFLFEHWQNMSVIWNWSLFGNVFLAIASILLIRQTIKIGWFPSSLFWSIHFIGSLLLIVSFAICLGSYYNALSLIDDKLYLFETIRGIPLYLFNIGALFQLSILIIYFQQGFSKDGIVPRSFAFMTLLVIVITFLLIVFGLVSFAVFAIACFLAPLLLGIFFTKVSLTESQ